MIEMTDGSLRAKQEKLQLEEIEKQALQKSLQPEEAQIVPNAKLSNANEEWRRFYEVVHGIVKDMRS